MRLYLLPLSTRRTLLFCQRLNVAATDSQTLLDKAAARATRLWASWEARDSGWQRRVVDGGNALLRRVPYEEWALKSVPPLSARRRRDELLRCGGNGRIEVVYPQSVLGAHSSPSPSRNPNPDPRAVEDVLLRLATERQGYHRKWLFWCFVGMPISAPFALVPVIPNLPFFYLVYRAWSHWKALAGGKHIQFLVKNKLLVLRPSPALDHIYTERGAQPLPPPPSSSPSHSSPSSHDPPDEPEKLLMTQARGKEVSRLLGVPHLEVELERAIYQVESRIQPQGVEEKRQEKKREQDDPDDSDSDSDSESNEKGDYKARKGSKRTTEMMEAKKDRQQRRR